ncbi:DNA-3-methyladenine glycosylase [Cellulomonas sp. URHD0024]|uniref:DNA-3-methyladenine glycosylase family protein n=1 Tax=Cellulomonas sp. URHD0024 TaxID=1302620 RepID=UPI0012DEE12B|nr:AlkA N-terminal domain-containing protein [Cellulomonas sp. URHD0024]
MTRTVTVRRPFDPAPAVASLVAHAVPGVELVTADTVRRMVTLDGEPAVVEARLAPDCVTVRSSTGSPAALESLADRWFGLADDLGPVTAAFADDPVLGPLVSVRPSLRILGHPDGFEAAVTTVLGQQVSLGAARVFGGRLAAAYGSPGPEGLIVYPSASRLASVDPADLQRVVRITHARARTVHALAVACADGLRLQPDLVGTEADDVRARLLSLPGIGAWTVDYLALRVLGDRDALPTGDLVLRRMLRLDDARAVAVAAAPWRPWRAFAAVHLWTARAYAV